jgi:hypothetical protein
MQVSEIRTIMIIAMAFKKKKKKEINIKKGRKVSQLNSWKWTGVNRVFRIFGLSLFLYS